MTATVEQQEKACPECGGPVDLTAGGRVRWHRMWRVGRGGRIYQGNAMCTGRGDG